MTTLGLCKKCGAPLDGAAPGVVPKFCRRCGTPIVLEPPGPPAARPVEPPAEQRVMAKTMVGFSPFQPRAPLPVSQPMAPSPNAPGSPGPVGLGPPAPSPPAFAAPAASAPMPAPSAIEPTSSPKARVPVVSGQTMLGVSFPGLKAPDPAPVAPPPGRIPIAKDNLTMMGVGSPFGQLPPQSSVPQPSPLQPYPQPSLQQAGMPESVARPRQEEVAAALPRRKAKRGVPVVPVIIGIGAIVLVAGLAAAFLWRNPTNLVLAPGVAPNGAEVLTLQCPECKDGTKISALGGSAVFAGGKAQIEGKTPLVVGENVVEIRLEHPGGKTESLQTKVPMIFRARPRLEAAEAYPPKLLVEFEAKPGTSVTVDAQPLTFDPAGHARIESSLESLTTGPSSEWGSVETHFRYRVQSGGAAFDGEVPVKLKVLPLRLDSPGQRLATSQTKVWVAGRTAPGGRVFLDGQPMDVDAQGSFAKEIASTPSEHALYVTLAGAVPRKVPFSLRPFGRLADEVRACAKLAPSSGSAANAGDGVVIDADVLQARVDGHATLLATRPKGCTSGDCTVRVVYGLELTPSPRRVVGCGRLGKRQKDNPPEVEAEWLVPQ